MANLEIVSAVANVTNTLLTQTFTVDVTVKNLTSSSISLAMLQFSIDGATAVRNCSNFSIGGKKTVTVSTIFDGEITSITSMWLPYWIEAMKSRRFTNLYVKAYEDKAGTKTDAYTVEGFIIIDAYYEPKIDDFKVERTTDEAETVKTTIKLSHADGLTTDQVDRLTCSLRYWNKGSGELGQITIHKTVAELIAGITEDTTAITDTFGKDDDFLLTLTFEDTSYAESKELACTIAHSFANLHLSGKSTGGACFGGFCKSEEKNPMLETYFPFWPYGHIIGQANSDCGIVSEQTTTSGSHISVNVTFTNPFPTGMTPVVLITPTTTYDSYYMGRIAVFITSITNEGFTALLCNYTSSSTKMGIGFTWLAIGRSEEVSTSTGEEV